jgi:hypothetical protein
VARLWIALLLLALDLVGLSLLVRRRVLWSALDWRLPAIGLGVVVAAWTCLIRHRYTDKYFAIGFPLPAAAFEISTGSDFAGPATLPILCLDALLMTAVPLATLAIVVALRNRMRAS